MRVLICFDISDDKTRRKMVGVLEAYSLRCQNSVFEADVPLTIYKIMTQEIKGIVLGTEDKLFIYPIPDEDAGKIFRIGTYATPERIHVF